MKSTLRRGAVYEVRSWDWRLSWDYGERKKRKFSDTLWRVSGLRLVGCECLLGSGC